MGPDHFKEQSSRFYYTGISLLEQHGEVSSVSAY